MINKKNKINSNNSYLTKKGISSFQESLPFKDHNSEDNADSTLKFNCGFQSGFSLAVTLNVYPNGISVTEHKPSKMRKNDNNYLLNKDVNPFFLRTRETRDLLTPEGKFLVHRNSIKNRLESYFASLHKKGILDKTIVFLGVFTDPFHGFHKKFAQTMACLETLERFRPARLVVQSRSRLLLSALPTLNLLKDRAYCVIPMETRLENVISRYTPGQPGLEERLRTAAGLKDQGLNVTLSVCPLLPYGSVKGDAWKFAELLIDFSDWILIQPIYHGFKEEESLLRSLQITNKLEKDGELKILRPEAHEEIKNLINKLSPQHLKLPAFKSKEPDQLKLFAA